MDILTERKKSLFRISWGVTMLKEWFWWQIEATVETLDDESTISLSDMTICFWIALALTGCVNFS